MAEKHEEVGVCYLVSSFDPKTTTVERLLRYFVAKVLGYGWALEILLKVMMRMYLTMTATSDVAVTEAPKVALHRPFVDVTYDAAVVDGDVNSVTDWPNRLK